MSLKIPKSLSLIKQAIKNSEYANILIPAKVPDDAYFKENDILYQALSWYADDEVIESDDATDANNGIIKKEFVIYSSGRTVINNNDYSIVTKITGFTPYFYVKMPDKCDKKLADAFMDKLKELLKRNIYVPKKNEDGSESNYKVKIVHDYSYGIKDYTLLKRKVIYPFTNYKLNNYVRIVFNCIEVYNKVVYLLKDFSIDKPFKIGSCVFGSNNFIEPTNTRLLSDPKNYIIKYYDTNLKPINRFFHVRDIKPCGFIILPKGKYSIIPESVAESSAQINTIIRYTDVTPNDPSIPNPCMYGPSQNFKIFSWDIECMSGNKEDFPNPENKNDFIGQIGVTLYFYATRKKQKFIFVLKNCSKISKKDDDATDPIIIVTKDEKELLNTFTTFVDYIDPDILIGYNTWGFDDKYTSKRLEINKISGCLSKLSRLKKNTKLVTKTLSSGAMGDNEFTFIDISGRITIDLYVAIRREYKLESFKLEDVSEYFLKQHKEDMPPHELFQKIDSDNPDEVAEVASYCVQDTSLVCTLTNKLMIISNLIEMANTTYVPIEWLLFRGQQCKVFSLLALKARLFGYVIPIGIENEIKKIQGALVKDAVPGTYYQPVAALDFASLYPSIMRAHNMCYTTIVLDDEYKNLPGYIYETFHFDEKIEDADGNVIKTVPRSATFIQNPNGIQRTPDNGPDVCNDPAKISHQGILPSLLAELASGRAATKKEMKSVEKGSLLYNVLDGKQLSQKIVMNSSYGFTCALKGMLPCMAIGGSVTARGREMITQTGSIAVDNFDCDVVYGDSVPGYEHVLVSIADSNSDSNQYRHVRIDQLETMCNKEWEPYRYFKTKELMSEDPVYSHSKEQIDLTMDGPSIYTKSLTGYSKIRRIIRHKTVKDIYQIKVRDPEGNVHTVHCTEGHSLFNEKGLLVKSEDLVVGSKLWMD